MDRPPKISNLLETIRKCLDDGRYLDTRHAFQRQTEREITRPEVQHVLRTGFHEAKRTALMKTTRLGITRFKERQLTEENCG